MRVHRRLIFVVGWVCIVFALAPAGAFESTLAPPQLIGQLEARGYENIDAQLVGDVLVVWCENRRIRYPVTWMSEALWLAASSVSPERRVRVVAEKFGRPVVALEARAEDVVRWMAQELPTALFRDLLTAEYAGDEYPAERANSSLRRVDLTLGPGRLLSQFGLAGAWIKADFDASARLTTALAPGLAASGWMFIPLYNKGGPVDVEDRYSEVRPGSFLVSLFQPLGRSTFSTATVGAFELGRWQYDTYGVTVDVDHATLDGRWTVGASVGYLGSATYRVRSDRPPPGERYRIWEIVWPPDIWPYEARVAYRFDGLDFHVIGRWGRFLNGDRGWRLDLRRNFGEVEVTVFGIKSDYRLGGADPVDRNQVRLVGGMRLEVPIFPRQRGMPRRFRVTPAQSFAWSYRYRPGDSGIDVTTEYRVEDLVGEYNPGDLRNNLDRARAQVHSIARSDEPKQ